MCRLRLFCVFFDCYASDIGLGLGLGAIYTTKTMACSAPVHVQARGSGLEACRVCECNARMLSTAICIYLTVWEVVAVACVITAQLRPRANNGKK
jgi:hypothetical protein